MSFSQGLTGLSAAAANLDAIGNNIANSATVGFKSAGVAFKDVYAGSSIGLGVGVAGVVQNFSAGTVQLTSRPLDLAITDGSGFFRVAGPDGSVAYSRNGQFTVDKDGYVVSTSGMRLTGYAPTAGGGMASGSPTPLIFPTASMPPAATAGVSAQFNLDARSAILPAGVPDPADSGTYSYANALSVFDSLGNPHELALYFVKTADNTWQSYGSLDGGTPDGPFDITFDASGNLLTGASAIQLPVDYGNGSVSGYDITVNLAGSTQFGNTSAVQQLGQDGYTSGVLTSYEVAADGMITGSYSNGESQVLGQVALSGFANPNGLEPRGNNEWSETSASGQPLTGAPGAGSTLGSITSGALEASNVDLTAELVNLIVAQRSYQANAQTLKTQDQVMQTVVNLR